MGYYIQCNSNTGKADAICKEYGAKKVTLNEATDKINDPQTAIICVVSNGFFEAAGFCYNDRELMEFAEPTDYRPKTFLAMDRRVAKELTGYTGE